MEYNFVLMTPTLYTFPGLSDRGRSLYAARQEAAMNEFHYTSYAQEVIFGPGSLTQVGEAIDTGVSWTAPLSCVASPYSR